MGGGTQTRINRTKEIDSEDCNFLIRVNFLNDEYRHSINRGSTGSADFLLYTYDYQEPDSENFNAFSKSLYPDFLIREIPGFDVL